MLSPGARVHIQAARFYNRTGRVTEIRQVDSLGRVSVQLEIGGAVEKFHACDLEVLSAAPAAMAGGDR